MVLDESLFKSARCPRGSGKSHGATGYAMYVLEREPAKRVLIIGLTLKSAKENFWENAPGGVQAFNARYDLQLDVSLANTSWRHKNGSVGFLAGAETAADLERLRGSKVEADLIIVDECKSFAPERLKALVQDILLPGLARRSGQLLLIGTPGSIPTGTFYEATCEAARDRFEPPQPTCVPWVRRDDPEFQGLALRDDVLEQPIPRWSLHSWTIQDNHALPKMWARALLNKRMNGWGDDHPAWRREYLGEWVEDASDLVYAYAGLISTKRVNWLPAKDGNKHGLSEEGGPWHYIAGVDFGFEDDFAIVVLAYGEHDKTLYHVWEFKENHLTLDRMQAEIEAAEKHFGGFETIVADAGGLGKVLLETMSARGLAIHRADKTQKFDHIELVNSDFHAGRFKLMPDSELHHEMCGLQWDLSKASKEQLIRTGKMRESPGCPNHLCDAALYAWRYAYHQFAKDRVPEVQPGTLEWWRERELAEKEAFAQQLTTAKSDENHHLRRFGRVDHLIRPRPQ